MQAYILGEHGRVEPTGDPAAIRRARETGARLWLDLRERTPEAVDLLEHAFGVHPLVIEDLWLDTTSPKIDRFDGYLYVVLHGVRSAGPNKLDLVEVDLILGEDFVITQHNDSRSIRELHQQLDVTMKLLARGPAWLGHALIDRVIDRYLPIIAEFDDQIDAIEAEVIMRTGRQVGRDLVPVIFALKRSSQKLSRIVGHQLEILRRLSSGEFPSIPSDALPYFRDVFDHFARVTSRAGNYDDVVTNTLGAYLSVQSNRMNETVKTLTLMSTFMLPLSFIAGLYGMNFRSMPETQWEHGYLYVLCLMATVALAILLFFRRKGWL